MAPHECHFTFEQAVRWNDELLSTFAPVYKQELRNLSPMCAAVFSLS